MWGKKTFKIYFHNTNLSGKVSSFRGLPRACRFLTYPIARNAERLNHLSFKE
jgi:hypothetical protein